MKFTSRTIPVGTLALFLLWVLILAVVLLWWRPASRPVSPELRSILLPEPRTLLPFSLVDQRGEPFSESSLRDKWAFLFFGYTYCPDICPTTLATLKQVKDLLNNTQDASKVQVVFVSVDPERDSPETLKRYMAFFDEAFYGLSGRRSQIDQLAAQAGAGYVKEPGSSSKDYLISHSASIFLVNPLGQIVAVFPPPLYADKIASLFRELRSFY